MRAQDSILDAGWIGSKQRDASTRAPVDSTADPDELDDIRAMLGATDGVAIMLIDGAGLIRRINSGAEQLLGWAAHELVGRSITVLHLADELDPSEIKAEWTPDQLRGAGEERTWRFRRHNGAAVLLSLRITPVVLAPSDDEVATSSSAPSSAYVVTATDVTTALARSTDLRREHGLSSAVIASAPALLVVCRNDGTVVRFNSACEELTGRSAQDVTGMAVWDLGAVSTERARRRWERLVARGGMTSEIETIVTDRAGDPRLISCRLRQVPSVDGIPEHVVVLGQDITDHREGESALRLAAETDALTGLANRPALAAALQNFASSADRSTGHLLFADLDEFKQVNDAYGHQIGDLVLAEISNRMQATVRRGDLVARFGGDEFVVFAPGLGVEEAAELARRLRRAVCAPVHTLSGLIRVGVSIGAVPVAPGDDWRELLAMADHQMYDAKRESRARSLT